MKRLLATYNQAISCALIGAGMAITGKSLVASLDPMILIFLRASIACLFLVPFIRLKQISRNFNPRFFDSGQLIYSTEIKELAC